MKTALTEAERDATLAGLLAHLDLGAAADRAEQLRQLERRGRVTTRRRAQIKGPSAGTSEAILAQLNAVDRQHDIIEDGPDLLKNPPGDRVPVSSWNHNYVFDPEAAPAGWATLQVEGGQLRASVTWNDDALGRVAAARVEAEKPDWSWTLDGIETRPLTAAERAAGARRVVVRVLVVEASPVDKGASIASGTAAACVGGACPLLGAGKCGACETCPVRAGALAPDDPRRQAMDARLAALVAKEAQRAAADERARNAVLGDLEARQHARDAADEAARERVLARLRPAAEDDGFLDRWSRRIRAAA